MRSRTTRPDCRSGLVSAVAICVLASACAVNPATGKRQFVLISESQEIAIGRESDQAITAQMGLYDDPALQEYVQRLGERLAAVSERPALNWSFRVVDDPIVNAFALPGGYLYITRGILAHFNTEAELVAVLGHEIGHVTARHGVSQMSKSQLAQLGLGIGSVLADERLQGLTELAAAGVGLMFLKFGRDDERQADDLGLRYLLATGYDAQRMVEVFEMLGRVSAAQGGGRVPGWQSTHPAPENRSARIASQIEQRPAGVAKPRVEAGSYLARLDGLVFGENPRDGYFEENLFLHPRMQFRFRFPAGWTTRNQRTSVIGTSPGRNAQIELSVADESDAASALEAFFSDESLSGTGPTMGSIHRLPTAGDGFRLTRQDDTNLRGRVGFVEYRGQVFRLLGYSTQPDWDTFSSTIRAALASFDRVTDRRVLDVQPRRLGIVRLDRAISLADFARRHGATVPVDTLALINGLDPGERLVAGRSYKIVTGGPN